MTTTSPELHADERFSHEALFYEGNEGFLDGALPFIRDGLARDEAVLVAVSADRAGRLERELGDDARRVGFLDMATLGGNPSRIIPAWRDFVDEHVGADRPARGIGEPIWPGRTDDELVECHLHESLLNLAFADSPAWRLLCPYDTETLDPSVIEEARTTHPSVWEGGVLRRSDSYRDPQATLGESPNTLSQPTGAAERLAFGRDDLRALRGFVAAAAAAAGLSPDQVADAALAASEVASNSIVHGGGHGTLTLWREPGSLTCEVRDRGRISDPLVGRRRPAPDAPRGRGMWVVNQVCDLVEVRALPEGSVVRFRIAAR